MIDILYLEPFYNMRLFFCVGTKKLSEYKKFSIKLSINIILRPADMSG
jgi:hypothetical protein